MYLADDDAFVCEQVAKIFKQFNLDVDRFADGVECLEGYKKSQQAKFILMDVEMPNLDGFEVPYRL